MYLMELRKFIENLSIRGFIELLWFYNNDEEQDVASDGTFLERAHHSYTDSKLS